METPEYFASYDNLDVHRLMLRDTARNNAYATAIANNRAEFAGKTVLDLGAGTGILSVFCGKAGAAKVFAVEASDIYRVAQETAKENGLENTIQVIHSRIEDVNLPEKVDIIVSEWMGFYLFHEGMLDSLIYARDRFLKPTGMLFPESATLYASPCSIPSMFDVWNDVSGVSMKCFASKLRLEASHKPIVELIQPEQVLSEPEVVLWIDLREVTLEDVAKIDVKQVAVCRQSGKYQGVALWFTCTFPSVSLEPVVLSTAPEEPRTHWKQTIIVLPQEIDVEPGTPIAYQMCLAKTSESCRKYNIEFTMLDPEEVDHGEYCSCHMTKCILVRAVMEKYEQDSLPK